MKIGITICEYNPFHNGHLYALEKIKQELSPDALIVIMSGNFTQRGEVAVMHKYTRAKHALLAGADMVVELPTVFSVAPAEIFAKGAVKTAQSLNGKKTLFFGTESGNKEGLISTATTLSNETKEFKVLLKEQLKTGVSFAKARYNALEKMNLPQTDLDLTLSPNNILGLEYTKAIIENKYDMDIYPIIRKGAGYKDKSPDGNIFSANGIRELIATKKKKKTAKYIPSYVYSDLPDFLPDADDMILYSLLSSKNEELAKITDCSEGIENRIKALLKDNLSYNELLDKLVTKRYTAARMSRIMLCSLLKINSQFTQKCLKSTLYLKILAIKKSKLGILSELKNTTPFILRKSDVLKLSKTATECFNKDVFANDLYNIITKQKTNEFNTLILED